jgi:hypothetical protein
MVWRRARARGELAVLAAKSAGRKPTRSIPETGRSLSSSGRLLDVMTGRAERPRPWGSPEKLGGAARRTEGDREVMIALVEERRAQLGIGPAVRSPGAGPRDVLSAGGAARRRRQRPHVSGVHPGRLDRGGSRGCVDAVARGAVRRSAAGAGLRLAARCRPAAALRPARVSGADGQQAVRERRNPTDRTPETARDRSQP